MEMERAETHLDYLRKIKELLDFMQFGARSWDSALNFVSRETFYDFEVMGAMLNVVQSDGSIYTPVAFGWTQEQIATIPARKVTSDTPPNRSLRYQQVVECGDIENYQFASPDAAGRFFPNGFVYSVAWPIPGIGSVITFCAKKMEMSPGLELFLLAVGSILSLENASNIGKTDVIDREVEEPQAAGFGNLPLTNRQWAIASASQKGRNNSEIAQELGMGASLVRQESLEIYRRLRVSGRSELQEIEELAPALQESQGG